MKTGACLTHSREIIASIQQQRKVKSEKTTNHSFSLVESGHADDFGFDLSRFEEENNKWKKYNRMKMFFFKHIEFV